MPGKGQLHAERVGHEAADQRHRHTRKHVLHGDHLVIGGEEILAYEALLAHDGDRLRAPMIVRLGGD